jgi:hypothetical protein
MHLDATFEKLSMETQQVSRAWIGALILLTVLGGHAAGQNLSRLRGIPPTQEGLAKRHMSPLGKPCLTIEGYAKPDIANKNIYQHLIKATNECGQDIKVSVCYYQTEHCVLMSVPAWENKTTILGIFPALYRFQFETKEQF